MPKKAKIPPPPAFEDDPLMQLLVQIGRDEIFHPKIRTDETDQREFEVDAPRDLSRSVNRQERPRASAKILPGGSAAELEGNH